MKPAETKSSLSREDRYLRVLWVALALYAIVGKGFAYIGFPPVFCRGNSARCRLWLWIENRLIGLNARSASQLLLIGYMIWGALRAVPDFGVYGADTLRDSVVWGYALFALVVSGLLLAKPERLAWLGQGYMKFVKIFLLTMPFGFVIGMWFPDSIPLLPISNMPSMGPTRPAMCSCISPDLRVLVHARAGVDRRPCPCGCSRRWV